MALDLYEQPTLGVLFESGMNPPLFFTIPHYLFYHIPHTTYMVLFFLINKPNTIHIFSNLQLVFNTNENFYLKTKPNKFVFKQIFWPFPINKQMVSS